MNDILVNICFLQEYFYKKVSKRSDYQFEPSDRDTQYILGFINILKRYCKGDVSSVGSNYLYSYFLFQYNCRSEQETRFGKGVVMLNWILGKKSFQQWLDRKGTVMFYEHQFCSKYNVSYIEYKSIYFDEVGYDRVSVSENEELEKRRFFSTDSGFLNCIESTTLYNHRSKWCLTCKYKVDCKKLLKFNYLHIYKDRGYWAEDTINWKNEIESRKLQKVSSR